MLLKAGVPNPCNEEAIVALTVVAMPQCSLLADFLSSFLIQVGGYMLCLGCWYIGVYVACSGKGRAFVGPGQWCWLHRG